MGADSARARTRLGGKSLKLPAASLDLALALAAACTSAAGRPHGDAAFARALSAVTHDPPLHDLPGNERNLDLAQAVRRAGWNVLTFTYRGAWGSDGDFSIANAVEDTHAAMAFLL